MISLFTLAAVALVGTPASAMIPTGTASVAAADAKIVGAVATRELGSDVAAAGDTNGDGYDDFVVLIGLNSFADPTAYAFLFLGPVTGTLGESAADAVLTPPPVQPTGQPTAERRASSDRRDPAPDPRASQGLRLQEAFGGQEQDRGHPGL